ncbi:MAG: ribonuclease P protein component [Bacteroidetes bacterium]|nr:ribonuclease P protein component [Bacteroidota bacterium]
MLQALFNGGNSFVSYPLRVVWAYIPAEEMPASPYPAQLAVAVSKRHVKTAVARNSIKRRIREAYRLHKPEFYQKLQQFNGPIGIMLMYVGKELLPFEDIEAGVLKMIRKFPGDRPRQHPTNGNPDRTP